MHYKALIFDFFGVLCPEVSPVWFREQLGARGDALKGEIFRDADRGVIPQERVFAMLAEMSNMSAESIEQDW